MNKNDELKAIHTVENKILDIYPFLTQAERDSFVAGSRSIVREFGKNRLATEETIKEILGLLNNGHADIAKIWKASPKKILEAKKKMSPTLKIEDRTLIVKILSWGEWLGPIDQKLITYCKRNVDKYDAILINVRNNKGGNSQRAHNFASIFFDKTIVYGKFISKGKDGKLKTEVGKLKSDGKLFIEKPIAILISDVCFSSNELFLAPFKVSKRATLIGQPTAGGSANPTSTTVNISGKKFMVRIPTWRFYLKGKRRPLEETKIQPDIVYKGDDIVDFATRYLKGHSS